MNNLWNPIRYEKRYFWSLDEILAPYASSPSATGYNINTYGLLNFIATEMGPYSYSSPVVRRHYPDAYYEFTDTNYQNVILLVLKRFKDHFCFYTDSKDYPLDKTKVFVDNLLNLLYMTSPRYLKLLSIYASADTTLLDPIEITSSGTTRFNDTPQDSGDFATDSHTTNITEDSRTTSNDLDTKMGRIREIESSYNNILLNWSNEFESLFLEEANI